MLWLNFENRVQSIDLFRGIAIISVVLGHYNNIIPFFEEFGGLGVDLFFVISGFLVGSYPIRLFNEGKEISFKDFFFRRAFKILPSYLAFISIGWAFAIIFITPISPEDVFSLDELPQYLFFYRNYGGPPPRWAFEHVWSLCVEEHFYILLPIFFIVIQKFFKSDDNRLLFFVVFIICLGIGFKFLAYITMIAEHPTYTHNRIDALGLGVLLSLVINNYKLHFRKMIGNDLIAIVGIVLFIFLVMIKNYSSVNFYELFLLHTLAPISFFLIILGVYTKKSKAFKPFQFVAYYSYNIYLWHYLFVIPITFYFGTEWLGFSIFIFISLIVGILFTILIEEPFLKIRTRFLKKEFNMIDKSQPGWE